MISTVAARRAFTAADDWQCTTLGHVAQVKGGKRLPKGEKFADTVTPFPYIRVTDFANFSIDTSDLRYLTPEVQATIERYTISKNDVYISIAGSIGITGMIPTRLDGANLTENAAKLVLKEDVIDPRFLMYYLASEVAQTEIRGHTVKNAQPKLALVRIASLEIPLPPLPEQRKIAEVLGLVQRAIEQQERLIALTTDLKKALLHKLFTEGLRGEPQKQTEIGLLPESWELKTIGDLFKFSSGKSRPKDTEPVESVSKPFPVYGGNGILGYSGSFLLEHPVLLLGRVGEYCGCAHHTEGRAWISDNALYAKEILGEIDTLYAAEFFAYANLNQYSNRAGQPLITQGIISEVKIPLPPLDEQRAILEPVTLLNRKLKLYETKRSVVTNLFRTLLHQLMTAQIRVLELDLTELKQDDMAVVR
jgi:type I restriction enzyme S subunit